MLVSLMDCTQGGNRGDWICVPALSPPSAGGRKRLGQTLKPCAPRHAAWASASARLASHSATTSGGLAGEIGRFGRGGRSPLDPPSRPWRCLSPGASRRAPDPPALDRQQAPEVRRSGRQASVRPAPPSDRAAARAPPPTPPAVEGVNVAPGLAQHWPAALTAVNEHHRPAVRALRQPSRASLDTPRIASIKLAQTTPPRGNRGRLNHGWPGLRPKKVPLRAHR